MYVLDTLLVDFFVSGPPVDNPMSTSTNYLYLPDPKDGSLYVSGPHGLKVSLEIKFILLIILYMYIHDVIRDVDRKKERKKDP